jgi:hypothetical protein
LGDTDRCWRSAVHCLPRHRASVPRRTSKGH